MKIWLPTLRAGSGADVFSLRLARGLNKLGHEALIEWFPHEYEFIPYLLKKKNAPADTDLIHSTSWQGFAFQRKEVPLVITEHNYYLHPEFVAHKSFVQSVYHKTLISHYVSQSYHAANEVISVSEHNAVPMRHDFAREIKVIHNWVDTDEFRPKFDIKEDQIKRPFRLLYVGNPSKWKGSDLIDEIIKKLPPDVILYCLGGLRSSSKLPSGSNCTVLERHDPSEMADLYRSMDAVLVISRYESFGYVALEAMASGIPVIGFRASGTQEVCGTMDCALLSEMNDVDGVISSIARLSQDNELCRRLGNNGRRAAMEYYSEDKQVKKYIDLYEKLLNQ